MVEEKTQSEQQEKTSSETAQDNTTQHDNAVHELTGLLQRTQANFENYRKQTEKRVQELKQIAAKDMILQILPLIDNLELAFRSLNTEKKDDSFVNSEFVQGIQLIYGQLMTILEHNGVQPIQTENQKYNPHYHEALMKVESELPEHTIVEEFQRGFTLHGQVVRHAKVKISSGKKTK